MTGYVTLIGSEDVSRAGYTMRDAAHEMNAAAGRIEYALEQHQRFMDDWIIRLTETLNPEKNT